jgi:hypothetical protein
MMPDRELTCEGCGQVFVYASAEQAADDQAGYPPPNACPACQQLRRATRDAKRAARQPRRRRSRR